LQLDSSSLGKSLVRISLAGRLDSQGVDRIETKFIAAIVPESNNAIVDLSGVEFMASMGIRMLVSAARSLKTRQAKIALYGATPQVGQVIEAVSLQKIMAVCATEAEALAAVAAPTV
jgi:anti-sigma B factor antagonist